MFLFIYQYGNYIVVSTKLLNNKKNKYPINKKLLLTKKFFIYCIRRQGSKGFKLQTLITMTGQVLILQL